MYETCSQETVKELCKSEKAFLDMERLIKTEELYQLGKVCHEVGNQLTLVISRMQMIEENMPNVKEKKDWLVLRNNTNELSWLFRDVSRYSRGNELHKEKVDLLDLLEDVLMECEAEGEKEGITFCVREKNTWLPAITDYEGDYIKLREVIQNLLKNAMEEVKECQGDKNITIKVEGKEDGTVVLSIQNPLQEGKEFPDETIFNAFYTSKKRGSGLGLSISKKIVEAHGGTLRLEKEDKEVVMKVCL